MQRRHYTEEEKNTVMSQYAMCGGEVKAMLAEYGIPTVGIKECYTVVFTCISMHFE